MKWVLSKRQAVSRRLHVQANRKMAKRTVFLLNDAAQLRAELGMSPARSLLAVHGVEARHLAARRLDSRLRQKWQNSSLYTAFMCIHKYEGAWNANTGNGYYGGLQEDVPFQRRYGGDFADKWGTANKWPVWAQLEAAVRAYRSGRGFWPWPNTARVCGLL